MPLDGTDFEAPMAADTGLSWVLSKRGCSWIEARLLRRGRGSNIAVILRALVPVDRNTTIVRLLQDAKGLIEDPRNWTRRAYRSLRGRHCAVGALRAISGRLKGPSPAWSALELLIKVARSRGFASVEAMNDGSSHDAVLAAFDEAIALAQCADFAGSEAA